MTYYCEDCIHGVFDKDKFVGTMLDCKAGQEFVWSNIDLAYHPAEGICADYCDDDSVVAGGVEIPESMFRKDVVEFSNFPDDDLSRTILQFIGLYLWSWTDEQKKQVIEGLQNVVKTM